MDKAAIGLRPDSVLIAAFRIPSAVESVRNSGIGCVQSGDRFEQAGFDRMEYRLYFTDPRDSGLGYLPVLRDDDVSARKSAEEIAVNRPFELWYGHRLVYRKGAGATRRTPHDRGRR